jgi:hypothetical protein
LSISESEPRGATNGQLWHAFRTRLKLHSRTGKRHERGDRSVIAPPLLNKPCHRLQDGTHSGAAVCGFCGGKFPDFIDHLLIKAAFTRALNFAGL